MDCLLSATLVSVKYLTIVCEYLLYLILLPLTPVIKLIWNFITRKLDILHDPNHNSRPWDLEIRNWKLYAYAVSHGLVGMIEAFLKGWWHVEDVETLIAKLALHPRWCLRLLTLETGVFSILYNIRWNWFNIQTKERAKKYCTLSYNLGKTNYFMIIAPLFCTSLGNVNKKMPFAGKDFFATFLDSSFLFSVAYYGAGATNLETAQRHKMELTAANMKLKPGMRVLDLGCGFGGFSHYLATQHDVNVLAVTNSSEMATATRELCAGLNVQVWEADWRDLTDENGSFDRVVGIEVLFHVGRHNIEPFFRQISKWLKPEGICVLQDFAVKPGTVHYYNIVHQYFFPGCYIYELSQIMGVSEKYFSLEKYTDLTPDLERTSGDMLKNLVKNWPQVENKYDSRYFKLYRMLFAGGVAIGRLRFFVAEQFVFRKLPSHFPL